MATAVEEPKAEGVSEQASQKTKAYAQKVEDELKALANTFGPQYWKMAELIYTVKEKNTWQILGYESQQSYREHLMVPKATWFERRRLWEEWARPALDGDKITRARLNRMPSQNVKQLLRLGSPRMFKENWIVKALEMTEEKLEAEIDHVLENNTETVSFEADSGAILKMRCTLSQKTTILDKVHEWLRRQELPIDEEARGLELMLADYSAGWPESGRVVD